MKKDKTVSKDDGLQNSSNILQQGYILDENDKIKRENEMQLSGNRDLKSLFTSQKGEQMEPVEISSIVEEDNSAFLEQKLDPKEFLADFLAFMKNQGVELEEYTAKTILSSMLASRLLVFSSETSQNFGNFTSALCSFFGTQRFSDQASGVDFATEEKATVCVLTATDPDEIELNTILRYAQNPYSSPRLNQNGEVIPQNVWWLVLSTDVNKLPKQLAEMATYIDLKFVKSTVNLQKNHTPANFFQFLDLLDQCESAFEIDEELWKKFDAIEQRYAKIDHSFSFSNRLWRKLEKFVATLVGLDQTQTQAVEVAKSVCFAPQQREAKNKK